jgi:hypothetical protein
MALAGSLGLLDSFPFSVPFFSAEGEESVEELPVATDDFFA